MGCNRISSAFDSNENELGQEQIVDAEHDVLWEMESYYDNNLGAYIQIAETNRADEYIAFTMDEDAAYIEDISEMEDDGLYYSYGDRSKGYLKGAYIKEKYTNCSEVRVYDISSYLGSD
ncbi:MAG: hypothetical protein ACI4DO_01060 [Roseburia sp.]